MEDLKIRLQTALRECERLRDENKRLRYLLGISETTPLLNKNRIITKKSTIKDKIKLYRSLFKGRQDVYAQRWESAKSGKSGYSPACQNEWHPSLCEKPNIKCSECLNRKLIPISDQTINDHLNGDHTMGIYPLLEDETCWLLAVDFDKKNWKEDVSAFLNTCDNFKVPANIERSRSGNGAHVWIFFETPIPASLARKMGSGLLSTTLNTRYQIGLDSYDRLFPNQDTLPKGGFGNLIALPLQLHPGYNGNSLFVNRNFEPFRDQWTYLSTVQKMSLETVKNIVNQTKDENVSLQISTSDKVNENTTLFPKEIKLVCKNGIYIEKRNLPPSIINQLIQLGTLNNPEFYKAQKKRLSTHGIKRKIDCVEDYPSYIILPRGALEDVEKLFNDHSINTIICDHSNVGEKLDITLKGQLRPQQQEAVSKLLQYNNGILSATTGFGKTVVAASLIAERKVNTLIIVHRKQLLEQWTEQLSSFLEIDPNSIGRIGGGKNKPTGKIDVATIQSLNHQGKVKDGINQYGQIIVDECHHISAFSFEQVLKKAAAKFVHGLTATPTRKDGLILSFTCNAVQCVLK
ncbi:TOTE conflict system archaeo-eukaryotic primase domain-containing protein [Scopulibacillus cellulosilyticus]|uniref:DEAD/DEAH box helicase family protein n=1 Tax=Scopulibacillus cellulosilyticus TaxID=2665665 RepID=A0ABW2PZ78_9BACL